MRPGPRGSCLSLVSVSHGLLYTVCLNPDLEKSISRLRSGDVRTLARAISTVENRAPGWSELLKALFPHSGKARVLGLTGPPGAGKSTLVDQLARYYRKHKRTVGIIAVDPTSPYTGGAILGAILGGAKGAAIGATAGAGGGVAAVEVGDRQEVSLPAGSPTTVRLLAPLTVTVEER